MEKTESLTVKIFGLSSRICSFQIPSSLFRTDKHFLKFHDHPVPDSWFYSFYFSYFLIYFFTSAPIFWSCIRFALSKSILFGMAFPMNNYVCFSRTKIAFLLTVFECVVRLCSVEIKLWNLFLAAWLKIWKYLKPTTSNNDCRAALAFNAFTTITTVIIPVYLILDL